ncbi:MAG TPA: hypothetical protein VG253_13970 [Streptosporangiaceae bacterium]|nr:hypothetical protein [Streptosporangiaceae bacterium]
MFDVAGGQPADPDGRLGVEQDEEAGQAVAGADGVIVEQPAGGVPAGLLVEGAGRARPAGGGEDEAGETLAGGPPDEMACFLAVGRLAARQPSFEVTLAAGRECQVLGGEPVEQDHGGADALAHHRELLMGGVLAAGAAAQAAQKMPDGVAAQELPLTGIVAAGEYVVQEPFEAGHLLVPPR